MYSKHAHEPRQECGYKSRLWADMWWPYPDRRRPQASATPDTDNGTVYSFLAAMRTVQALSPPVLI